jgi:hypothetical protein
MLAARYILKVFPGLVLDTYRWRPPGEGRSSHSPFEGENLLHLLIVKRVRTQPSSPPRIACAGA